MRKSNIICFVAGAMLFGTVGVFAGQYTATENPFPVQLNGSDVTIEGYNINDSTYFKLRDIASVVGGFDVDFNNNIIQLSKDGYVYDNTSSDNIADSDSIVRFARIGDINGQVYGTPHAASDGGFVFSTGNTEVYSLPDGITNLGDIYKFCCYNNRIYYLTGLEGSSDSFPASIYSCNVDGSDNKLIADNAGTWSQVFIYNNCMYYNGTKSMGDYYVSDNIYRLDLATGNCETLISGNVDLILCTADGIYYVSYENRQYYLVDYDGTSNLREVTNDLDETSNDSNRTVYDNTTYYISEGVLYSCQSNDDSQSTALYQFPTEHITNIMNIDDKYVYCVYFNSDDMYNPKAEVYIVEHY